MTEHRAARDLVDLLEYQSLDEYSPGTDIVVQIGHRSGFWHGGKTRTQR